MSLLSVRQDCTDSEVLTLTNAVFIVDTKAEDVSLLCTLVRTPLSTAAQKAGIAKLFVCTLRML